MERTLDLEGCTWSLAEWFLDSANLVMILWKPAFDAIMRVMWGERGDVIRLRGAVGMFTASRVERGIKTLCDRSRTGQGRMVMVDMLGWLCYESKAEYRHSGFIWFTSRCSAELISCGTAAHCQILDTPSDQRSGRPPAW